MTTATNDLGIRGEKAAEAFLQRCGMKILECRWKSKAGEADIIALDENEIVFVEVKTRHNNEKGAPEDAVGEAKQKKYFKLATEFIAKHETYSHNPVRFDVISILVISDDRALLRHHRSAFVCE